MQIGDTSTLKAQKQTLLGEANAILRGAGDVLTSGQQHSIELIMGKIHRLDEAIMKATPAATPVPAPPASSAASGTGAAVALVTRLRAADDPKHGFKHFAEFVGAVREASSGRAVDERLFIRAGATTYGNESAGQDGGYLVPIEFARQVATLSLDATALLPLTDQLPITGNSITYPSDETTPWSANGVRAFWAQEAAAATATKPLVKANAMRTNKLIAFVPMTDELVADSAAASAFLATRFGRAIKWKVNDAIVNGDGAGQPFGILNSPALVVIAKDAGQAANTISGTNLANMFGAMPVDYLESAVWLVTPDAMPKVITAQIQNVGIWSGPGSAVQYAPGGFLLGKPVIPTQACAALSAQGDVIFTSLQAYTTISKDMQIATSMHLYFDADLTAFRATFRVDGQPTFKGTVAQARGAQAQSPYVTLAAR